MALLALAGSRERVLRWAGTALLAGDPVLAADLIVVTIDAGPAGILEAADLVHSGISSRVAVFGRPATTAAREFIRRGVAYEDAAARETRQLHSLGIGSVQQIARDVAGSEQEGATLPDWLDASQLRSVVVVSSPEHSRRLRRILHRSATRCRTHIMIRPARYSEFNADHWWQTRAGVRTEAIELEKLMLDFLRHPIS
jgi:hypothetical protein